MISSHTSVGCLPSRVAPVNAEVTASHEAAGVAEQEDGCAAVLVGRGQPTQHVLLGPLGAPLGKLFKQLLDHGGDDVAGGDCVDADAQGAPFGGQVPRELHHGGFAGIVGWADEALDMLAIESNR